MLLLTSSVLYLVSSQCIVIGFLRGKIGLVKRVHCMHNVVHNTAHLLLASSIVTVDTIGLTVTPGKEDTVLPLSLLKNWNSTRNSSSPSNISSLKMNTSTQGLSSRTVKVNSWMDPMKSPSEAGVPPGEKDGYMKFEEGGGWDWAKRSEMDESSSKVGEREGEQKWWQDTWEGEEGEEVILALTPCSSGHVAWYDYQVPRYLTLSDHHTHLLCPLNLPFPRLREGVSLFLKANDNSWMDWEHIMKLEK